MTRVKALLRHWLDVPSRAEHQRLARKASECSTLWCLYGIEREAERWRAGDSCATFNARVLPARADVDRALAAHGAMVPFTEERPLVPMEPAPREGWLPRDGRGPIVVGLLFLAFLFALIGGLTVLDGCTIRGGADCAGGCPPAEVCAGERCVVPDLRPVPAPGGPV